MSMLTLILMIPAITIPMMNHPLSLGALLLMQVILISLITGSMNLTFWYSYIMFLIMVGGMLVLFMYMMTVASNEKFKFSSPLSSVIFLILFLALSSTSIDQLIFHSKTPITETFKMMNPLFSLNKFLNFPLGYLSFMLIIYLLITMIVVIEIIKIKQGPLRHRN